jgi:hypothetical protein
MAPPKRRKLATLRRVAVKRAVAPHVNNHVKVTVNVGDLVRSAMHHGGGAKPYPG